MRSELERIIDASRGGYGVELGMPIQTLIQLFVAELDRCTQLIEEIKSLAYSTSDMCDSCHDVRRKIIYFEE